MPPSKTLLPSGPLCLFPFGKHTASRTVTNERGGSWLDDSASSGVFLVVSVTAHHS